MNARVAYAAAPKPYQLGGEEFPPLPDYRQYVLAMMRAAGMSQRIIGRIEQLNPVMEEGCRIRGLHRATARENEMIWRHGHTRRKDFIGLFGRDAFDRLKPGDIVRHGRRRLVTQDAIRCRSWEHPNV